MGTFVAPGVILRQSVEFGIQFVGTAGTCENDGVALNRTTECGFLAGQRRNLERIRTSTEAENQRAKYGDDLRYDSEHLRRVRMSKKSEFISRKLIEMLRHS